MTFTCPILQHPRSELLGQRASWEELDEKRYLREGTVYEATEEFFSILYTSLV